MPPRPSRADIKCPLQVLPEGMPVLCQIISPQRHQVRRRIPSIEGKRICPSLAREPYRGRIARRSLRSQEPEPAPDPGRRARGERHGCLPVPVTAADLPQAGRGDRQAGPDRHAAAYLGVHMRDREPVQHQVIEHRRSEAAPVNFGPRAAVETTIGQNGKRLPSGHDSPGIGDQDCYRSSQNLSGAGLLSGPGPGGTVTTGRRKEGPSAAR